MKKIYVNDIMCHEKALHKLQSYSLKARESGKSDWKYV